jgi:hypothetical protein
LVGAGTAALVLLVLLSGVVRPAAPPGLRGVVAATPCVAPGLPPWLLLAVLLLLVVPRRHAVLGVSLRPAMICAALAASPGGSLRERRLRARRLSLPRPLVQLGSLLLLSDARLGLPRGRLPRRPWLLRWLLPRRRRRRAPLRQEARPGAVGGRGGVRAALLRLLVRPVHGLGPGGKGTPARRCAPGWVAGGWRSGGAGSGDGVSPPAQTGQLAAPKGPIDQRGLL